METSQEKLIHVAAAVIFRHGKLLITQRGVEDHLGGLWEFPGGKVEAGESFEACLQREIKEELGSEIQVGLLFETIIHHYPEKSVSLRFYLCRWEANEPKPIGCQAVAWVSREELDLYTFPAADIQLLAQLKSDAELWRSADQSPP